MKNASVIENEFSGLFWTRESEMVSDIEDSGYTVDEVNDEYVAISDDDDNEYLLYLGHANSTMWVERVRDMN